MPFNAEVQSFIPRRSVLDKMRPSSTFFLSPLVKLKMGVEQVIDIPIELEREIFELAVYDDPQCAPRLMLVARRVHDW